MHARTISIHHIRGALAGARRAGLDLGPLLHAAGIAPALLDDSRARVTGEQAARLVRVLIAALDDEFMGLGPYPSKRGTFAMMCHAAVHSKDLRSALLRATKFYELFPGTPRFRIRYAGSEAQVELDIRGVRDPDHFMCEGIMIIWHGFSSWLIGQRIPLHRMEFRYPRPPHAVEYDLAFGCRSEFGSTVTAATFDRKYLDMPVIRDGRGLTEFLRHAPADLASPPDYTTSAGESVRRILANSPPSDLPSVEAVAGRLSISPQTLRRRLAEEGTSFRQHRDDVRRDIAIDALTSTNDTVEDIAARLGYADSSAFHRAFKRWTGRSPGSYRAEYR
ncbi:AraC family transcriptional regulator [Thermocrispum municipale]|jgi:AraC-like DNA-binding protein|uniref:AraC family transcriptional regulator n=1 Tax=Thermocrispum municipale TaxID=37926 RepID=UPI000414DA66|nr:AraC family transcriptional regulator [Thermocrispum municipale]